MKPRRTSQDGMAILWALLAVLVILAAVTAVGLAVSLYFLNPGRRDFEKKVVRTFHRGVGQVERIYARTGFLAGSIESTAENLYASLRSMKSPDRDKD